MKLFLYDSKHERILSSMKVENKSQAEKIIAFLEINHITSRYARLVLADDWRYNNDEDADTLIEFLNGGKWS